MAGRISHLSCALYVSKLSMLAATCCSVSCRDGGIRACCGFGCWVLADRVRSRLPGSFKQANRVARVVRSARQAVPGSSMLQVPCAVHGGPGSADPLNFLAVRLPPTPTVTLEGQFSSSSLTHFGFQRKLHTQYRYQCQLAPLCLDLSSPKLLLFRGRIEELQKSKRVQGKT